MTSGITVNIPDKVYKIARGDNAVIPCTFTPSATITSIYMDGRGRRAGMNQR